MQTIARLATRYRWFVLVGWIVVIAALQALAAAAGGASYKNVFTLPHTETQTVLDLLKSHGLQNRAGGQVGTIVVHARTGRLDPQTAPAGLAPALHALCTDPKAHVDSVTAPWPAAGCDTGGPGGGRSSGSAPGRNPLLSTDGSVGLVTVAWQYNENDVQNFVHVHDVIAKLGNDQVQYEFTGNGFGNLAAQQKGIPPELFGFIAALIILGVIFRNVPAALSPLLSAVAALGSGLALIALLSHVMNVADFATQLAQLMVIGVGVDYALFIVTRHRRNLLRGMAVNESIALAIDTSGRAVLFAGATVCIAILGLCALGVSFLYGVAIGTSIAVALTMVASLTLLPAVLSLLGHRVLPRKVRRAVKAGEYVPATQPTRWAGWSRTVQRHGFVLGSLAALLIVVLAIPFFSMRLGRADESSNTKDSTQYKGYQLIAHAPGFGPGYNSVLQVVVSGPTAADPAVLQRVASALKDVPDVNPASVQATPAGRDLAFVNFKTISQPQAETTTNLVHHLRSTVVPQLEQGGRNQIYVFGQTAILVDFAAVLSDKMPLFFVAVIGLSFLLLMVAFRSLVIPLTAAVMNVFAAGASFGVLVAIFQWGWLGELLGIGGGGPIDAFLPVLFFAILFGLSMDYQVFLVSRMHEE